MSLGLIVDALIVALLGATVVYGVILSRRLAALRKHQSELGMLIGALNEAAARAEAGIAGLKVNAEQAGASLQSSIDKARRLSDELSSRTERGGALSERGRNAGPRGNEPGGNGRRQLEREILNALRAAKS